MVVAVGSLLQTWQQHGWSNGVEAQIEDDGACVQRILLIRGQMQPDRRGIPVIACDKDSRWAIDGVRGMGISIAMPARLHASGAGQTPAMKRRMEQITDCALAVLTKPMAMQSTSDPHAIAPSASRQWGPAAASNAPSCGIAHAHEMQVGSAHLFPARERRIPAAAARHGAK